MSEQIVINMDNKQDDNQPKDWIIRLSRRDIEKFYFVDKRWCINARRSSAVRTTKEIATSYAKAINKYHSELTAKIMRFDSPISSTATTAAKASAVFAILAALTCLTARDATATYRSASCQTVATSAAVSGCKTTTWRTASGSTAFSRTGVSKGHAVYRDKSGSVVATRQHGSLKTVYRDKSGSINATSSKEGSNRTVWRDKSGSIVGTETIEKSGTTVYRDASGHIIGSKR